MNLETVHSVYFLGIGGIGMSAIARYFKEQGAIVSGYDKTPSSVTESLESDGIAVCFDENQDPPSADLFVFTPAIPKDHPAFEKVSEAGNTWYKRSEVLEEITRQTKTIAIAGTHGKTTTTAITAHILHQSTGGVTAFVGGTMSGYESNFIASQNPNYVVVEADEYDRSFLRLHPDILLITSLDPDHLDIYGTYEEMVGDYKKLASKAKTLIVNERISAHFNHPNKIVYGNRELCDYRYSDLQVVGGSFTFRLNQDSDRFALPLPGEHNVENAVGALSIALMIGVNSDKLRMALTEFKGVKRRFERVFESQNKVIIDDYAHHPEEIKAVAKAARRLFPENRLAIVFQPHLYSRTKDLEDGFVESLSQADEVILVPIYPARETPIEGVSSANLLNRLPLKTKQLVEKADLLNAVLSLSAETVLILGAGDIDRLVQPIVNEAKKKYLI